MYISITRLLFGILVMLTIIQGIFTGLDFELKEGNYLAQPTFDSFSVFRIRDKISNNYWIIYGTKADLIASCSTCCDGSTPIPMPG